MLREGIEAKQFRAEVPVEIAGLSIIGMVNWMYKWYKPDGPMSIEQIATAFNDLILHSLLTEEAKRDEDISSFLLSHVGDE